MICLYLQQKLQNYLKNGLLLKLIFLFINIWSLSDFSAKSFAEFWMLFISEVVVWMIFTNCNFNFSLSSKYIVISAFSILSTSLRKSMSDFRINDGYDALFICFFS